MTRSTQSTLHRFNRWAWLLWPVLLFLGIFFLYPTGIILQRSITPPVQAPLWGLDNFIRFFQTSVFSQVLFNTIRTGVAVTLTCLLIGYPYAYLMNSTSPRRQFFLLALLLSLWSPLTVAYLPVSIHCACVTIRSRSLTKRYWLCGLNGCNCGCPMNLFRLTSMQ